MEPSPSAAGPEVQATFAQRFRNRARARHRLGASASAEQMSFADFMTLALYDLEYGYYAVQRERVGRGRGTDFYTASSMDSVFGPLVAAAASHLLGGPDKTREHAFFEIGAEPGRSVLSGAEEARNRFAETQTLRLAAGDAQPIPARAVVFSNELFDAQPFHRMVRRDGAWRELGVRLQDDACAWCELEATSPDVAKVLDRLPREASEGYTLDLPLGAVQLLEHIVARPWRGLFLAFDYGRTWEELCTGYPAGTGRAYAAHKQSDDLLANPGRQDLTCHVCWDWLADALHAAGFTDIRRQSQESFLMHHAAEEMERIVRADRNPLSRTRTQLKHLLHPGIMGQKFEVLRATRG